MLEDTGQDVVHLSQKLFLVCFLTKRCKGSLSTKGSCRWWRGCRSPWRWQAQGKEKGTEWEAEPNRRAHCYRRVGSVDDSNTVSSPKGY